MIGIINYNAGNTGSIQRALNRLNIRNQLINYPSQMDTVSGLIFPGAGAAGSAMQSLTENKWIKPLQFYKKPFLGLCLGMQLLFEYSEENDTKCLGIIKGKVKILPDWITRPHLGWNKLNSGNFAYFVHSYFCQPKNPEIITMTTNYGLTICAGIKQNNFLGVQWHPENSGATGDRFLLYFSSLCK